MIVGGGLAGAQSAEALRDKGFDGQIVIIAAEVHLPYERPALSKDFLAGKTSLEDLTVHDAAWYRGADVDLRLGTTAASIDTAGHTVGLEDGGTVRYDKLLLATGSGSRRLPVPGADARGVLSLRTVEDAMRLDAALARGSSLAIVGAGWIGLEVAASARARGVDVTVVEAARLPLLSALGTEAAGVFAALHRDHGVDLRLECNVAAVTVGSEGVSGLTLDDGATIAADTVVVAVGAAPNTALAEAAGLATGGGGVLVDAALRTSDADVFAVGDIAAAENPLLNTRIRTEHWANARKQPAVAAASMLGESAHYAELPYFFTDQYDLGMEYVGHAAGYERVVFRGDVAGREFVAFWLDASNRVLAGMNVNVWDVVDEVKALIRTAVPVDTDRLADPGVALGNL